MAGAEPLSGLSLTSADNDARIRSLEISRLPIFAELDLITRQRCVAKHGLSYATVFPNWLPITCRRRLKSQVSPFFDQGSNIGGIHGAIPKQMIVVPGTPSEQKFMILLALFPAAGVFRPDHRDRYDEIDELECDGHGVPPIQRIDSETSLTSGIRNPGGL